MTVNETITLAPVLVAGVALGLFFFGGLWWTVGKGVSSPHPARWFFGSLLLRTSLVLAGFYIAGGGQWQRLLACLLGFVIARFLVLRLTRAAAACPGSRAKEGSHAP